MFFGLNSASVKPLGESLGAMDIVKITGGICGGVSAKNYAVYRKWIDE